MQVKKTVGGVEHITAIDPTTCSILSAMATVPTMTRRFAVLMLLALSGWLFYLRFDTFSDDERVVVIDKSECPPLGASIAPRWPTSPCGEYVIRSPIASPADIEVYPRPAPSTERWDSQRPISIVLRNVSRREPAVILNGEPMISKVHREFILRVANRPAVGTNDLPVPEGISVVLNAAGKISHTENNVFFQAVGVKAVHRFMRWDDIVALDSLLRLGLDFGSYFGLRDISKNATNANRLGRLLGAIDLNDDGVLWFDMDAIPSPATPLAAKQLTGVPSPKPKSSGPNKIPPFRLDGQWDDDEFMPSGVVKGVEEALANLGVVPANGEGALRMPSVIPAPIHGSFISRAMVAVLEEAFRKRERRRLAGRLREVFVCPNTGATCVPRNGSYRFDDREFLVGGGAGRTTSDVTEIERYTGDHQNLHISLVHRRVPDLNILKGRPVEGCNALAVNHLLNQLKSRVTLSQHAINACVENGRLVDINCLRRLYVGSTTQSHPNPFTAEITPAYAAAWRVTTGRTGFVMDEMSAQGVVEGYSLEDALNERITPFGGFMGTFDSSHLTPRTFGPFYPRALDGKRPKSHYSHMHKPPKSCDGCDGADSYTVNELSLVMKTTFTWYDFTRKALWLEYYAAVEVQRPAIDFDRVRPIASPNNNHVLDISTKEGSEAFVNFLASAADLAAVRVTQVMIMENDAAFRVGFPKRMKGLVQNVRSLGPLRDRDAHVNWWKWKKTHSRLGGKHYMRFMVADEERGERFGDHSAVYDTMVLSGISETPILIDGQGIEERTVVPHVYANAYVDGLAAYLITVRGALKMFHTLPTEEAIDIQMSRAAGMFPTLVAPESRVGHLTKASKGIADPFFAPLTKRHAALLQNKKVNKYSDSYNLRENLLFAMNRTAYRVFGVFPHIAFETRYGPPSTATCMKMIRGEGSCSDRTHLPAHDGIALSPAEMRTMPQLMEPELGYNLGLYDRMKRRHQYSALDGPAWDDYELWDSFRLI